MKYLILIPILLSCSHITPLSTQPSFTKNYEKEKTTTQIPPVEKNILETLPSEVYNKDVEIHQTVQVDEVIEPSSEEIQELPEPQIFYPKETVSIDKKMKDYSTLSAQEIQEIGATVESDSSSLQVQETELDLEEESKIIVDPSQVAQEVLPEQAQEPIKNFSFDNTYERKSKWLNYFAKEKNKQRLQRFFNNGFKYKELIENILEENELPKDLFFVGMIESGYQLKARSKASAVGPWQFIRSAGKQYGLKINSLVDERRDIFKATKAAALYFKDLYNIFGSWELALSGYNAGPYRIINLITRENTRDFAILSKSKRFPKETADYVPKLQAVMEIYNNMQGFGIELYNKTNPFDDSTLIPLKYSLSLKTISKKLNITKKELLSLNPELVSSHTPFLKNSSYQLRIPNSAYQEIAVTYLRKLKEKSPYRRMISKSSTKNHRVRKGENLYYIAAKYKTTIKKIMKLNKFKNHRIYIGQTLRVPKRNHLYYTVKKGDNLSLIGKKFGKKSSELSRINKIKSHQIFPGQKIIIK